MTSQAATHTFLDKVAQARDGVDLDIAVRAYCDEDLLPELCQMVDEGLMLPARVATMIAHQKVTPALVRNRWSLDTLFQPGPTFSNTRLALVTADWLEGSLANRERLKVADAALPALVADGQLDFDYTQRLVGCALHAWYSLENITAWYANSEQFASNIDMEAARDKNGFHVIWPPMSRLPDVITAGRLHREELFATKWLPSKLDISAARAGFEDMSPTLLADLYPREWQAGYGGYRAALMVSNT